MKGKPKSFFYFRSPTYLSKFSVRERVTYDAENEKAREKLQALKTRIQASERWTEYLNPSQVAETIKHELERDIQNNYAQRTDQHPMVLEKLQQDNFAQDRIKIYVERKEVTSHVVSYLNSPPTFLPLVITGQAGIGKV